MSQGNRLYYGDNLDVLRRYIPDESVDLVYLDPPFNSNATYNVLFAEHSGERAASQIKAFEDTWHWDRDAESAYEQTVEAGGRVSEAVQAFRLLLGSTDMMAYLAMMAPRLVELHRALKSNGSIYLHCDPTASHYLKVVMDAIFGPRQFRSEIVWKRSTAHSDVRQGRKQYGNIHDILLFYTKGDNWTWSPQYVAHDAKYVETHYPYVEPETGRHYGLDNLTGPGGAAKGNPSYEVMGVIRYWRYSEANMRSLIAEGRVVQPRPGAVPRYKRYLDEMPGVSLQDVWTDVPAINSQAKERLGYPTQKPQALLERIIRSSSNEGDLVLDPFCGCGTAVVAAQQLGRRWIGMDITHLAINLMRHRLMDAFGEMARYDVIGEPVSVPDAEELARSDPYQFQWWALGLVGARPVEQKKGADHGIDGRIYFHDGSPRTQQVVLSVKAGHVTVSQVRDLRGVLDREAAAIGVLISMESPTSPMRTEAASAGYYDSPWGKKYPRLQLLTVAELLDGRSIDMPPLHQVNRTFRRSDRAEQTPAQPPSLFDEPAS